MCALHTPVDPHWVLENPRNPFIKSEAQSESASSSNKSSEHNAPAGLLTPTTNISSPRTANQPSKENEEQPTYFVMRRDHQSVNARERKRRLGDKTHLQMTQTTASNKPHKCLYPECSESFDQAEELKSHLRTHTNPFLLRRIASLPLIGNATRDQGETTIKYPRKIQHLLNNTSFDDSSPPTPQIRSPSTVPTRSSWLHVSTTKHETIPENIRVPPFSNLALLSDSNFPHSFTDNEYVEPSSAGVSTTKRFRDGGSQLQNSARDLTTDSNIDGKARYRGQQAEDTLLSRLDDPWQHIPKDKAQIPEPKPQYSGFILATIHTSDMPTGEQPSWKNASQFLMKESREGLLSHIHGSRRPVQDTYNRCSESVRSRIDRLVDEKNDDLWRISRDLEWTLAHIGVLTSKVKGTRKQTYPSRVRVILKTQPKRNVVSSQFGEVHHFSVDDESEFNNEGSKDSIPLHSDNTEDSSTNAEESCLFEEEAVDESLRSKSSPSSSNTDDTWKPDLVRPEQQLLITAEEHVREDSTDTSSQDNAFSRTFTMPPHQPTSGITNSESSASTTNLSLFALALAKVKYHLRPGVKSGYQRLEWTCSCGEPMYGDYRSNDIERLDSFGQQLRVEFLGNRAPISTTQTNNNRPKQEDRDAAAKEVAHCTQLLHRYYDLDLTICGMENAAPAEIRSREEMKIEAETLLDEIIGITKTWETSNRTWTAEERQEVDEIYSFMRKFQPSPQQQVISGRQISTGTAMEITSSQDITDSSRLHAPSQLTGSSRNIDPAFGGNLELLRGLHFNNPEPSQLTNRFFELCVDIGALNISLAEIHLTYRSGLHEVRTDSAFFALINTRYHALRRNRLFGFLFKPVDIHFVRFGIVDSYRVGIYAQPREIPPPKEVDENRYHYHECPLDPLPPIDRRTFFHYFYNHERHASCQSRLFFDRMPKKLHSSIVKQSAPNKLTLGWGVHIIEGPNKPMLSLCLCVVLVLSFVVSLAVTLVQKTEESGFGVGQWMIATMSAALAAVYFHLSDS